MVCERGELPSSIGLDFLAQGDDGPIFGLGAKDRCHDEGLFEFGSSSRWEKLSKEMGSEILPSGDGSCRPESVECTSILHQTDGVRSQRHHIISFGEFNGVTIALVV
ncbi:hypothetical protein Tco_0880490 [Tanacetum coccineum]